MITEREILIERILPNPMRDFKIYPMHPERIALLAQSYADKTRGGDFGTIIPVRPHPTREGFYQQACGHHRVATLKQAGRLKVTCQIADRDDDEMASIMVRENMVNYGNNAEALADSVAAICKVLSLQMFLAEHLADFSQIYEKCDLFTTEKAYESARGRLMQNGVIGEIVIHDWITRGTTNEILKVSQIKEALAHLNSTGNMQEIIGTQRKKAQSIQRLRKEEERKAVLAAQKAAEEAERQAEEERKAAELAKKAREEALAARREAEKRAKEAKAEADRKRAEREAAEAEARYAQEKVEAYKRERRRKALEKIAAEERAKEDNRKAQLAARQMQGDKLKAAQEKADAQEDTTFIHRQVINILKAPTHLRTFRQIVKQHQDLFPMDGQPGYAQKMVTFYDGDLTAENIAKYMEGTIETRKSAFKAENAKLAADARAELEAAEAEEARHKKWLRAERLAKEGSASLGRLAGWMQACDKELQDREVMEDFMRIAGGVTVTQHLHTLEQLLPKLRERMNVESRAVRRGDIQVEHDVIDIQ